jgi:hypothetical protein
VLSFGRLVWGGIKILAWGAFLVPPPKHSDILKAAVIISNEVCALIGFYAPQNGNLTLDDETESLYRNFGCKLTFYAV